MTTNNLNNQCLNDFTVTSSTNGVTRILTVTNTTNAANSAAKALIEVAGGTAADPQFTSSISAGQAWSIGLDNSDSDAFVTSGNAALGTTNTERIDTTGVINYPLQSAFLAYPSAQNDVTGDGTLYTIIYANEVFDQNADFDGTSTFTAPITGRYYLMARNVITGIEVAQTVSEYDLVTSNRTYIKEISPSKARNNNTSLSFCINALADMDVGDTAVVKAALYNGTKVSDISSSGGTLGSFSGILIC